MADYMEGDTPLEDKLLDAVVNGKVGDISDIQKFSPNLESNSLLPDGFLDFCIYTAYINKLEYLKEIS